MGEAEVGEAEVGDAEVGDAEVGDAEVGDALVGDAEVGEAVVGTAGDTVVVEACFVVVGRCDVVDGMVGALVLPVGRHGIVSEGHSDVPGRRP